MRMYWKATFSIREPTARPGLQFCGWQKPLRLPSCLRMARALCKFLSACVHPCRPNCKRGALPMLSASRTSSRAPKGRLLHFSGFGRAPVGHRNGCRVLLTSGHTSAATQVQASHIPTLAMLFILLSYSHDFVLLLLRMFWLLHGRR